MPQLSVQSVSDALTDSLRDRILTSDLLPGQRVTESQLTSDYQVARPTVKAAIERLVAEGLLERDIHRSAQVPVITLARANDIYFTRSIIECQAYRLLAQDRVVPPEAVAANARLLDAAADGRVADVVGFDVRFHSVLVDALESPRTSSAHRGLSNEMRLCMMQVQSKHLLDPRQIGAEHAAILDAIATGDADEASRRGVEHLQRAQSRLAGQLG